jgi:putative ABC transport system permease protein
MLQNYLLIAIRNLQRQLSYSLINIVGFAIGIACSLVIFMYIYGEWSYDRHYTHADHIYKVGVSFFNMGGFGVGPEALGEYLPKEFEGVEAFTRVSSNNDELVSRNDQSFYDLVYYTDSAFFTVFSYKFIQGNPHTALRNPASVVITESVARKYFHDTDALGKTIALGKDKKVYTVTGIVKDDKRSSQLKSLIWASNEDLLKHESNWASASMYNYILLKENNNQQDLEQALDRLLEKEVYTHAVGVPENISFEAYKEHPNAVKFYTHALTDVHLQSKLNFEISPAGNEANLYIFGAISIFILILASVNFVNLTTARAARRAKEVGIRKVVGSTRNKLISQFLLESVIMTTVATLLSLALAQLSLNVFQFITGETLLNTLMFDYWNIAILFAFALLVGILSGIYPALYLTSFKPVKVLKGNVSGGNGGFRNTLVIVQFSVSMGLMICAAVVMRQMDFMQTKDLGFNQESVVTIDRISTLGSGTEAFKNVLAQQAEVTTVSLHSGEPGTKAVISFSTYQTPQMPDAVTLNTYMADPHYLSLMGFQLIQGRDFNSENASDSAAIILNEAAVAELGLKNPIGAVINKELHVIGVVRDFHWETLHTSIAPTVIRPGKDYVQMGFRLKSNASTFIKKAEAAWKQFVPNEPLQYHFLDENFGQILQREKVLGKAIGFFTALAIFISCLGLYGLSAYTAEQRTKEIGIRKVLGATTSHVVSMLNKKFARLILTSVLIAIPASWYIMSKWMEGFAYKAQLPAWIYLAPVALAFSIALITVSFHSIKAALINPVDTLKYE